MIIRSLALRHGRFAIARSSTSLQIHQWQRPFHASIARRLEQEHEPEQNNTAPSTAFGLDASQPVQDVVTLEWQLDRRRRELTSNVGAAVEHQYMPGDLLENPPRPEEITLELLLASQCHLGHHTSQWHPANSRYIHGVWGEAKEAIHIISMDATASHLRRACKIVQAVTEKGGLILFVGTRKGYARSVVQAAKMANGCHLFEKFRPGTFSNAEQLLRHCKQKVVNHLDEEMPGFDNQLMGRAAIKPDLVVCLNAVNNYVLLHECGLHNIPTIGIVDTDTNPTWVTYPIPANDDSLRSISVIAGTLGRAAEQGVQARLARAKQGHVDFVPTPGLELPRPDEVEAWHEARREETTSDLEEDQGSDDLHMMPETSQPLKVNGVSEVSEQVTHR